MGSQELAGDPNPQDLFKGIEMQIGGHAAIGIRGWSVLLLSQVSEQRKHRNIN